MEGEPLHAPVRVLPREGAERVRPHEAVRLAQESPADPPPLRAVAQLCKKVVRLKKVDLGEFRPGYFAMGCLLGLRPTGSLQVLASSPLPWMQHCTRNSKPLPQVGPSPQAGPSPRLGPPLPCGRTQVSEPGREVEPLLLRVDGGEVRPRVETPAVRVGGVERASHVRLHVVTRRKRRRLREARRALG